MKAAQISTYPTTEIQLERGGEREKVRRDLEVRSCMKSTDEKRQYVKTDSHMPDVALMPLGHTLLFEKESYSTWPLAQ